MKLTLFSAAFALALTASIAGAQQASPDQQPAPIVRHHGEHRDPHRSAEMLSKRLNLTQDQTSRIEPILAARQQKMAALMADSTLDPKARHKQMHVIHKDTRQQLSGILTPEQVQQMKSLRHEGHGKRGGADPIAAPSAS